MKIFCSILILFSFFVFWGQVGGAHAVEVKSPNLPWLSSRHSQSHRDYNAFKKYNPYLENARHLQIPQWAHEDWYAEDWTSQTDGMTLIKGFYFADILRDQKDRPC